VTVGLTQVGGIGVLIFSACLLPLAWHQINLRERLLLKESLGGRAFGSVLRLHLASGSRASPLGVRTVSKTTRMVLSLHVRQRPTVAKVRALRTST